MHHSRGWMADIPDKQKTLGGVHSGDAYWVLSNTGESEEVREDL